MHSINAPEKHPELCDQIWRFFMFLTTNVLTKVAQIFGSVLGYFEQHNFKVKTAVAAIRSNFGFLGDFIFHHLVTLIQRDIDRPSVMSHGPQDGRDLGVVVVVGKNVILSWIGLVRVAKCNYFACPVIQSLRRAEK